MEKKKPTVNGNKILCMH